MAGLGEEAGQGYHFLLGPGGDQTPFGVLSCTCSWGWASALPGSRSSCALPLLLAVLVRQMVATTYGASLVASSQQSPRYGCPQTHAEIEAVDLLAM